MATRKITTTAPAEPVAEAPAGAWHEVLTEAANGHQTVHRLQAASVAEARTAVAAGLAEGSHVVDTAPGGAGLGTSDGRSDAPANGWDNS